MLLWGKPKRGHISACMGHACARACCACMCRVCTVLHEYNSDNKNVKLIKFHQICPTLIMNLFKAVALKAVIQGPSWFLEGVPNGPLQVKRRSVTQGLSV